MCSWAARKTAEASWNERVEWAARGRRVQFAASEIYAARHEGRKGLKAV